MPLYELFCLARPQLAKAQMADIIKLAGRTVLDKGGVITDIKSFGDQSLAYEIQRPGERHSHVGSTGASRPARLCLPRLCPHPPDCPACRLACGSSPLLSSPRCWRR